MTQLIQTEIINNTCENKVANYSIELCEHARPLEICRSTWHNQLHNCVRKKSQLQQNIPHQGDFSLITKQGIWDKDFAVGYAFVCLLNFYGFKVKRRAVSLSLFRESQQGCCTILLWIVLYITLNWSRQNLNMMEVLTLHKKQTAWTENSNSWRSEMTTKISWEQSDYFQMVNNPAQIKIGKYPEFPCFM